MAGQAVGGVPHQHLVFVGGGAIRFGDVVEDSEKVGDAPSLRTTARPSSPGAFQRSRASVMT